MDNRVGHVDIAKGISIITVALFHSQLHLYATDIIDSMGLFRMPLFFFLSGIFFNISANTPTFLKKKSDTLLKPYFTTLFALFIISILFQEEQLIRQFVGILYGNGITIKWEPLWFLTHLFAIYCFVYIIFRFTGIQEKSIAYKLALLALFLVIGSLWIDALWYKEFKIAGVAFDLPGLPFSLDIIFISSSFFMMGYFSRKLIINFKANVYLLFTAVLAFIVVVLFTNAYMHLNERIYINPFYTLVGAICGIYFVIYVSFYIDKSTTLRNIFLTFGQASLFILIFHDFIGSKTYYYLSMYGSAEFELWYAIIAFFISITIPLLIKYIIFKNRVLSLFYLPLKTNKNSPI